MGEVDYDILNKIYRNCIDICKENKLPYQFKVDSGNWETAIEFTVIGYHHPPLSSSWDEVKKQGNQIKCPDLLDDTYKIIIEYEEESKPGRGAKLGKKGHTSEGDFDNKRDTGRNEFYKQGGFRLFRIYDSDKAWAPKLEKFLIGLTIY